MSPLPPQWWRWRVVRVACRLRTVRLASSGARGRRRSPPLDPLPRAFQLIALANPITWHVDVLRYATIGVGTTGTVVIEAAAFPAFTVVAFAGAVWTLERES